VLCPTRTPPCIWVHTVTWRCW